MNDTSLPTICLITPPSIFLLDERVFVNLGILKVASVLEQAGYPLEMLDLSGIENYEEALKDHIRSSQAGIFGITSTTPQMPATAKIARVIRQEQPIARLIIGGPHVTLVHSAYKKENLESYDGRATKALQQIMELFDVAVVGDGEEAIFEAVGPNPRHGFLYIYAE